MTDLVVVSLESWDQVWRRNQHLVAGLLRADPGLRVLFVEPAADPLYALTQRRAPRPGAGRRPVQLDDADGRLWSYQPTKWLPRRFAPHRDRRWADRVVRVAGRLGFADPVLWANDPGGAELVQATGWPALYDITDDWLEADRTPAEHDRLVSNERLLMQRCAEVVVCSQGLARTKGAQRPVTVVPNAVEVDFYRRPAARPADLPPGPVAVYLGTIHGDRMDLSLCAATARALAGRGTLALVGPAPLSAVDRAALVEAGVVLLGAKDRAEVPGYLQHADVLVVPHVVTPFTDSLDPIKLYEYQAVGRPVVSTPVAGFREVAGERIVVAAGEAFVAAVVAAVPAADRFPTGADAEVASWADRVRQFGEVIDRLRSTLAT